MQAPDRAKVSVVIPCFNAEMWIERAVTSCIDQGPLLGEVIIVDDQSTDNSREIASRLSREYPDRVFLVENSTKGANNARNLGFSRSRFEFIQWLDADDAILPGKFERQVRAFQQDPRTEIVYSDWSKVEFDDRGNEVSSQIIRKHQTHDFLAELLDDNWSVPCNYLIRRRLAVTLAEMGAWSKDRPVAQDREYFTLAAMRATAITYASGNYSKYTTSNKHSVSKMNFYKRLEHQMILEKKLKTEILKYVVDKKLRYSYIKKLNSHVYNAFFYNNKIMPPFAFTPWSMDYSIIHWKKIALFPLLYPAILARFLMSLRSRQSTTRSSSKA